MPVDVEEALAAKLAPKALGVPEELEWHDCEVTDGGEGWPMLEVRETVQDWMTKLGVRTCRSATIGTWPLR